MSTASHSPHYIDHRSPAYAGFNTQAVEDPCLAAPYELEDDLSHHSFDLLSPVSHHENTAILRSSPSTSISSDSHLASTYDGLGFQSISTIDYVTDVASADLGITSPDNLTGPLDGPVDPLGHLDESDPLQLASEEDQSQEAFSASSTAASTASTNPNNWDFPGNGDQKTAVIDQQQIHQLLSPELTHNPSPSSDFAALPSHSVPEVETGASFSVVSIGESIENVGMVNYPPEISSKASPNLTSPVFRVEIEDFSREDPPSGEYEQSRRRSSSLLAPSNSGDEDQEGVEDEGAEGTWKDFSDDPTAVHNVRLTSPHHLGRAEDGSWMAHPLTGQAGLDPTSRGDTVTVSPNQMEHSRFLEKRNEEVTRWLQQAHNQTYNRTRPVAGSRRRARSAGALPTAHDYFSPQSVDWAGHTTCHIPGPGVLINVPSIDGMSDVDAPPSAPSSVASVADANESLPVNPPPIRELSNRAGPWKDPSLLPDFAPTTQSQPATANEAITRYGSLARDFDQVSRTATWGTRPRTDAEVDSLIESNGLLKSLNLGSTDKLRRTLAKVWPRGGGQHVLRKSMPRSADQSPDTPTFKEGGWEKVASKSKIPQRSFSFGRAKSPTKPTGGIAAVAMGATSVLGSVGGPVQVHATAASPVQPPIGQFASPVSSLGQKRGRSVSELPPTTRPAILQMKTAPEIKPSMVRPVTVSSQFSSISAIPEGMRNTNENIEEEEEDGEEVAGFDMDFSPSKIPPIPTLDGFRDQVKQLNPRIHAELIDRFAQEQLRRYKELLKKNADHREAVNESKCRSSNRCFALGGKADMLPARQNARESTSTSAIFRIGGQEGQENAPHGETTVTAVFPPGVPNPPVKQLPAQFECQLCFQVKRFYKPSDWTKHVHEDMQPFTCTFPGCTEPRSFARKADWVRHENEKHRQLEWWTCNIGNCRHTCHRNHNFVQHLVREHKMTDPKEKKVKTLDPRAKQERERAVDAVWELVNECRHETTKRPEEEACRFCGNYCADWKKLMIHLAHHMQQIALPILALMDIKASIGQASITTSSPEAAHNPPSEATPSHAETTVSHHEIEVKPQPIFEDNPQAIQPTYQNRIGSYPGFYNELYSPQVAGPGGVDTGLSPFSPQGTDGAQGFHYITPPHQNTVTYPGPYNNLPQSTIHQQNPRYITSLDASGGTPSYYPHPEIFESPTTERSPQQTVAYGSTQMPYIQYPWREGMDLP